MLIRYFICVILGQILGVSADVYLGKDCEDMYWYYWQRDRVQMQSGVKTIWPVDSPEFFQIYCEVDVNENTVDIWNYIQNRRDGTVRFDDSFEGYRDGFGNGLEEDSEFWLGNEKIHYLTTQAEYAIRFDMGDVAGIEKSADYSFFSISGEDDFFRLNLGIFDGGLAGDSMFNDSSQGDKQINNHNGQQFTTLDNDNDNEPSDGAPFQFNCAEKNGGGGGWWYDQCDNANLNGEYFEGGLDDSDNGIEWFTFDLDEPNLSLTKTTMKIKRKSAFRLNQLSG